MKLILYTDGGARNNPGPAAAGVVIQSKSTGKKVGIKTVKEIAKYLGTLTNNQAEYWALIIGLEEAQKLKATEVDCYLDSSLIVNQLNHRFKIKNHGLGPLFIKVWNLSQNFQKITYHYIPREKNKEADALVNQALDAELTKK